MKLKAVSGILTLAYLGYLVSNLAVIRELTVSQDQCAQAVFDAFQHPNLTNQGKATAQVEAGCARMVENGKTADKVMKAIRSP